MKKKPWRRLFIYIWTFPSDIFTWLVVLVIRLFWGNKLHWNEGLWCELNPFSWPARTWYRIKDENGNVILNELENRPKFGTWVTWGGTCFGHGGFYGPGRMNDTKEIDTKTEFHEHIHVEQVEVNMFANFILAIIAFIYCFFNINLNSTIVISLVTWLLGVILIPLGGWVVAWFRGEDPYRGSQHEESAYAQTNLSKEFKNL